MEDAEYAAMRRLEDRHWWYAGRRQVTSRMARDYLRAGRSPRMLDLGCGAGGNLAALQQLFPHALLHGADLHPLAVAFAASRGTGALCRATANALPYRDEAFDAVFSLDVFYSLEVDEPRALRESHRVLKDGGLLFVNLPAFESLRGRHDAVVHTRHRYTARELEARLAGAGFEVLRTTYWNMLLFPLVLAWRRATRNRPPGATGGSDLFALPGFANGLLGFLVRLERAALSVVDLPFGTSVFAVARKRTRTAAEAG